jgi:hypothetical protein
MRLSDFRVKTDFWPLVSSNDVLVIVFRDAVSSTMNPVLYIGCHQDATFTIQSAGNNQAVQTASPWSTTSMTAGSKIKLDLDDGNPLDVVSQINISKGSIFIGICAFDEFDAYFQQVTVPNS